MKKKNPIYLILALAIILGFGAYLQGLTTSLEEAWRIAERSEERWRAPSPRAVKVGCRLVLEEVEVCSEVLRR